MNPAGISHTIRAAIRAGKKEVAPIVEANRGAAEHITNGEKWRSFSLIESLYQPIESLRRRRGLFHRVRRLRENWIHNATSRALGGHSNWVPGTLSRLRQISRQYENGTRFASTLRAVSLMSFIAECAAPKAQAA
jgi:hypothetical protein